MQLRDRFMGGLARQLGHPDGWRGRLVGRRLNRGNRDTVTAAVELTGVAAGDRAADLGFGGGIGLRVLLERVGAVGHVDGVDVSETMLESARRTFRAEISAGRLALHPATMVDLPLDTASLDALITVNTIYFVEDLDRAFGEIARVLRPGATGVVGLADPEAMAQMPFTAHGFRLRAVSEVSALLERSGFSTVRDVRVGEDPRAFHLLVATRS
jgi:ubiquinone/menaquinone biosynthesis C-methylase UbiE